MEVIDLVQIFWFVDDGKAIVDLGLGRSEADGSVGCGGRFFAFDAGVVRGGWVTEEVEVLCEEIRGYDEAVLTELKE